MLVFSLLVKNRRINMKGRGWKVTLGILLILIFVLIYAISDEVHQYFVPGRAMALRDVLIDFSGGFTACLVEIIYKYIKK